MSAEKTDMLTARLRRQSEALLAEMGSAPGGAPAWFRVDCAHLCDEFGLLPERSSFSAIIRPDRASLAEALSGDCFCVEYFQNALNLRNRLAETMLGGDGFYLLLSTASAMLLEPDRLLMTLLAQRLGLGQERRDRIETAIHEALLNVLLYGNLELDSSQRQTISGFDDYCEDVERRLSDPCFAARWVEIRALWKDKRVDIDIMCNGQGIDERKIGKARAPGQKNGWGVLIMRQIADSMRYSEQGRNLSLSFTI